MNKYAWHVTPSKNIPSIIKNGLLPHSPEENGDMAISLFISEDVAILETSKWLHKKWNNSPLSILKIDITGLSLTQTFDFELITTDINPISSSRIISIQEMEIKKTPNKKLL